MNSHRFPLRLLTGAVMLALPVWIHAAGLGKLTVNSALGQRLSAEIELLVEDKSELDSIKANLASSQAFKDAQIEYAPVLSALQFSVGKRTDGRPVLKVSSSNAINDPFLDMLIELSWASGRLLREYTVLLDPPGVAVSQTVSPVAVSAPVIKPSAPATVTPATPAPKPVEARVDSASPGKVREWTEEDDLRQARESLLRGSMEEKMAPEPVSEDVPRAPGKAATSAKGASAPAPVFAPSDVVPSAGTIKVKRGDTLAGIASSLRPADVNLETVLVGLFRENPQAFAGNNMNRLKVGTRLKVPSAQTLAGIDAGAAAREVRLQAADWQAYRAKLAERVAATPAPEPEKKADKPVTTGKIASRVEDKAQPRTETRDVLKLSRGAAPATPNTGSNPVKQPDKMTADKAAAAKAAAEKAALEKAAAEAKAAAAQEERLAKEKADKEAAERATMLEKQIADMQKLAQLKEAEAANAGAQTPPPAVVPKVAANPPAVAEPESNWWDSLKSNPLYWLGGIAVVLLGGALWWMVTAGRQRKMVTASFDDSLLTGGDLSPGTVGAAATGGVVNTGDTSFLTDFSQAGLASVDTHDVDPIAEADVYMAYGRDAQAEEILREALTKSPDRHEIRLKLLEIHAARKNVSAFEAAAGELYAALGGQGGAIWDKAAELGRSIDPANPLYGGGVVAAVVAAPAATYAMTEHTQPESKTASGDMFSLDISTDEIPAKPADIPVVQADPVKKDAQALDFDLSGLDIQVPDLPTVASAPAGAMDFSGLDLNLEDMAADEPDEVGTKLELARAYLDMGDKEGAREILQEILNEGTDSQKEDARSLMRGL